jgi:hypothetical protein
MMSSAETHRAYRESVKIRRTFFETSRDYSTHANPRDAHARPESGMSAMFTESTSSQAFTSGRISDPVRCSLHEIVFLHIEIAVSHPVVSVLIHRRKR